MIPGAVQPFCTFLTIVLIVPVMSIPETMKMIHRVSLEMTIVLYETIIFYRAFRNDCEKSPNKGRKEAFDEDAQKRAWSESKRCRMAVLTLPHSNLNRLKP